MSEENKIPNPMENPEKWTEILANNSSAEKNEDEITIRDFLEELDGAGMVITDWEEIEGRLKTFGFSLDQPLEFPQ